MTDDKLPSEPTIPHKNDIVFKFQLGQTVWYLANNKVCTTDIFRYASCHGNWKENEIFASKEDLLKSL